MSVSNELTIRHGYDGAKLFVERAKVLLSDRTKTLTAEVCQKIIRGINDAFRKVQEIDNKSGKTFKAVKIILGGIAVTAAVGAVCALFGGAIPAFIILAVAAVAFAILTREINVYQKFIQHASEMTKKQIDLLEKELQVALNQKAGAVDTVFSFLLTGEAPKKVVHIRPLFFDTLLEDMKTLESDLADLWIVNPLNVSLNHLLKVLGRKNLQQLVKVKPIVMQDLNPGQSQLSKEERMRAETFWNEVKV